jgi:hypothetical protein
MHANKIGAKKRKQSFLMNPQVLTLSLLFSLKLTEGHLIANHQKIYLRKIKIDIKQKLRKGSF